MLQFNLSSNFSHLELNKRVIKVIIVRVVMSQDFASLHFLAFRDKPTRGSKTVASPQQRLYSLTLEDSLRNKPDQADLNHRGQGLEDGGDTPSLTIHRLSVDICQGSAEESYPVIGDTEGTEGRPSGNDRSLLIPRT